MQFIQFSDKKYDVYVRLEREASDLYFFKMNF